MKIKQYIKIIIFSLILIIAIFISAFSFSKYIISSKPLAVKEYEWATVELYSGKNIGTDNYYKIKPTGNFDINKEYSFLNNTLSTAVVSIEETFAAGKNYKYPVQPLADTISCALLEENITTPDNEALLTGLFAIIIYELPSDIQFKEYCTNTSGQIISITYSHLLKNYTVVLNTQKNIVKLNGQEWDIPIFDSQEVGLWTSFLITSKEMPEDFKIEDYLTEEYIEKYNNYLKERELKNAKTNN